jgi:hypothetical protein
MEERIATLKQQLKALQGQHVKSEAKRKREEAQRAKKDDTRRKLLAGTVVLEKVARGEIEEAQFREWLNGVLTQTEDRALFNL